MGVMTELLDRIASPEALASAQHILDVYGPWSIFGLALLVGIWQPFAPDVLVVATGLLHRSPIPMAVAAVLGTTVGALIGYILGRTIGTTILARVFRSRPRSLERIERLFSKYGIFAVTICSATPLPMKYALWMSGALRLSVPRYLLALWAGYLPRIFVVAWLTWYVTRVS